MSFPGVVFVLVISVVALAINFLPSFIAFIRKHPDRIPILVVNALIPILGFMIAFIWAFADVETE